MAPPLCVKCGNATLDIFYHKPGSLDPVERNLYGVHANGESLCPDTPTDEHVHVWCATCKFRWSMAPADDHSPNTVIKDGSDLA